MGRVSTFFPASQFTGIPDHSTVPKGKGYVVEQLPGWVTNCPGYPESLPGFRTFSANTRQSQADRVGPLPYKGSKWEGTVLREMGC